MTAKKFNASAGITVGESFSVIDDGGNITATSIGVTGNVDVGAGIFSNVAYNKIQNNITLNGNSNITFTSGAIINATASANFTPNLQSFTCSSGNITSVVLIVNQAATAYNPLANIGLNGANTEVTWQGGSQPAGNANKKDIITYSIANVGGTLSVFGQLISFG